MAAFNPPTPEFDGLSGDEIQRIADASATIRPESAGQALQGVLYATSVLCTVVFALRVYVRILKKDTETSRPWGIEDWLAVGGFFPYLPAAGIGIASAYFGVGSSDAIVSPFLKIKAKQFLLFYELVYFTSSTLTKLSIIFTIMRICTERKYMWTMYAVMAAMVITATYSIIFVFADCTPIQTRWNPALGTCRIPAPVGWFVMAYSATSVQILTDWTVALTPFFIIKKLNMNRRKKISVICILGLGVFASFAALMRMTVYPETDERYHPHDVLVKEARVVIWSHLEGSFGIIACNLPPLRKLFKDFYGSSRGRSGGGSRGAAAVLSIGTPLSNLNHISETTSGSRRWSKIKDSDDEAALSKGTGIVRKTDIKVETASAHAPSNHSADHVSVDQRDPRSMV